ncbi:MAG: hypothetical protein Q4D04_02210 [Clostridia bacterium]|nr:hypothetical protein [Clostridia bacterium]
MRKALPYIIVIFMALIDTSVLGVLSPGWATPMLAYTSVVSIGLLLGRFRGMLCGLAAGMFLDITVSYPMGLLTVMFMLAGYLSGFAGRRYQRYLLTVVVTSLVMFMAYEIVMALYQYIAGQTFALASLYRALIRAGIQTVLSQCLYLLYNVILKPSWSRYAGR